MDLSLIFATTDNIQPDKFYVIKINYYRLRDLEPSFCGLPDFDRVPERLRLKLNDKKI